MFSTGQSAPHVRVRVESNARCVLRSDESSLNFGSSVARVLIANRDFFRPRHTPYTQLMFSTGQPAPHVRVRVESNARCVLRSDESSLNFGSSVARVLIANRDFFRPRHTPYTQLMFSTGQPAPHVHVRVESNARCVLRSDESSLNVGSSVVRVLIANRDFFRPRHTPYMQLMFSTGQPAPHVRVRVDSNARCVLRSDESSLNIGASVARVLIANRDFFRPRHTPYTQLMFSTGQPAPHLRVRVESNARCVLRSDESSLNVGSSVVRVLDAGREFLRPRHTPY
jgi:hypothetical protein